MLLAEVLQPIHQDPPAWRLLAGLAVIAVMASALGWLIELEWKARSDMRSLRRHERDRSSTVERRAARAQLRVERRLAATPRRELDPSPRTRCAHLGADVVTDLSKIKPIEHPAELPLNMAP